MFKRKGDIIYCIMINNQIFSNKKSIKKRFIHKLCYLKKHSPSKHIMEVYYITKFKCIFHQIIDNYFIKNLYV
jgi:hypothetical protein